MTPFVCAAALLCASCERSAEPAPPDPLPNASPASSQAVVVEEQSPLLRGWETWTPAEAVERLGDDETRLSAAVRLIRIAGAQPVAVPDPLPPQMAEALEIRALEPETWIVGRRTEAPSSLGSPILILMDGEVRAILEGAEEEAAIAYLSDDPDRFPHLLVTPLRVAVLRDQTLQTAFSVKAIPGLRFELNRDGDRPVLQLVMRDAEQLEPDDTGETPDPTVAEFRWDGIEEMFLGPAADALPDPPGGYFELDLENSPLLIPVGGQIPEPPTPPTPQEPPPDLPPPY